MKYKLQIEKLKQLKMDGNLAMANQFENNEPMNITPEQLRALIADNLKDNNHKEHILKQFEFMKNGMDFFETELRRYYGETDVMKTALFQRNQIIQDLDQEIQGLDKDIEELNDKIESLEHDVHLTEEQVRHKKMDIELLKDRVSVLEKILLPHQELTQWIEEEIDNMDKNELLNFTQKLYDKVYKINHD